LNGLNTNFIINIYKKLQQTKNKNKNIVLAGGLTNYEDLNKLKKLNLNNLEGIISGKSFYTGNIDLIKAQAILDSNE